MQQFCKCVLFIVCTFCCRPCKTTKLRADLITDGNGNGDRFYSLSLSLNSDTISSLQFQPNFPTFKLLSDLVEGSKRFKGREVCFSATISLASPLSDLKDLYRCWLCQRNVGKILFSVFFALTYLSSGGKSRILMRSSLFLFVCFFVWKVIRTTLQEILSQRLGPYRPFPTKLTRTKRRLISYPNLSSVIQQSQI